MDQEIPGNIKNRKSLKIEINNTLKVELILLKLSMNQKLDLFKL